MNNQNIILDVASGSVHSVDAAAYDAISLYETMPRDELSRLLADRHALDAAEADELFADIEQLRAEGKLFAEDDYAPIAKRYKRSRHEIKALCLHVAHTCNLTCEYCFARQGAYHGSADKPALMTTETGKKAIDFLVASSGKRRNLEVDFFGGEPLMNWDVVKAVVAYARSIEAEKKKNFRFTLTTNGMLIDDEVIAFSNREMTNVVLSLDGRREVHDALRKRADGRGSYDEIVPKFQRFAAARGGKNYYIRGTFTHENTDFTEDILHMANLGFTELSMEPVVSKQEAPHALTQEDLPILLAQYERLAVEMLERERNGNPFTFYHYMLDLEGGPCLYKRVAGCGSGTEYLAVTPWGELYPCHQFVGESEYSMGTLDTGVTNTKVRDKFSESGIYTREECKQCWARLYCSGGCAANAYHATGDVNGVYEYGCELFRKRVECAIMMRVAQQTEE
jgi:uncharacterized protein